MKEYTLNGRIQTRARAHDVIRKMLASVGDPYTRFLSPEEVSRLGIWETGNAFWDMIEMGNFCLGY